MRPDIPNEAFSTCLGGNKYAGYLDIGAAGDPAARDEIRKLREEQDRQKQQIDEAKSAKDGEKSPKKDDGSGDSEKEDAKKEDGKNQENGDKEDGKEQEKKPHPVRNAIIIVAVVVLAVVGLIWWLNSRHYEDTDDAVVDGHISGIAAQISGTSRAFT